MRPHYFSGKISHGFLSIYSSRLMLGIASSFLGLFLPIFLYEFFGLDLKFVLFYYLLDYITYILIVPVGARIAVNFFGLKKSMIISSIWGALHHLMFFSLTSLALYRGAIFSNPKLWFLIVGAAFFMNLQRFLYWVPAHTDLSKFTDKNNRTREVSFLEASLMAFNAVVPIFSGWLLANSGYSALFIIAMLSYVLSAITLLSLPKTEEKFSWSYSQTWKEFFSLKRRKTILAFIGDGAESTVSNIIWPIFIWTLLSGNYFQVGAISSFVVISTIILQLTVGRMGDSGKKEKILRMGTVFYSLIWIIKMFIETAFQIFVVSTLHNLTRVLTRTTFDAMIYEKAADQGHYVDEYTVVHEMSIASGRILMLTLTFLLSPILGLTSIFILAAVSTLFMNLFIDNVNKNVDRRLA